MTKLNQKIKNKLKSLKLYKSYKTTFPHKQTRFIFLGMNYIIAKENNEVVDFDKIFEIEKQLIKVKTKNNFSKIGDNFSEILNKKYKKVDWKSFGEFIFYIWQTSTFFKDVKKKKKNVFTDKNYISINSKKREVYYKWLNTIKDIDINFNNVVKHILRKVL